MRIYFTRIVTFLDFTVAFFIFSHARHVGNMLIRGDDELYILQGASEIDGIVQSNNQYWQYWNTQPIYWQIIDKRLCVLILGVLIVN